MTDRSGMKTPQPIFLILVGVLAWWVPGLGHLVIGKGRRAAIIFFSILFAVLIGLWIGSLAVIDSKAPWYWAQLLCSPMMAMVGHISVGGVSIESFGRAREIGQIYTGVAGMLNLLCVVNAVYLAHCKSGVEGEK